MSDNDLDWEMSVDWSHYDKPIIEPVNHAFPSRNPPTTSQSWAQSRPQEARTDYTYPAPQPQFHSSVPHFGGTFHTSPQIASPQSYTSYLPERTRAPYSRVRSDNMEHKDRHAQDREKHRSRHHRAAHSTKFRFKDGTEPSRSHRHRPRHHDSEDEAEQHERHERRRRRYAERSDKRYTEGPRPVEPLDPDILFRESMFQAMADDEGLQFWEAAYGQPIPFEHVARNSTLEGMSEDEYAAHLRAEMYKKTHAARLEEMEKRKQRREAEARQREKWRREVKEQEKFQRQVEESLKRGKERASRQQIGKQWTERWNEYLDAWSKLGPTCNVIAWPVFTGKKDDVAPKAIQDFFSNAPTGGYPDSSETWKTLKHERFRWHPDKVQHKLGGTQLMLHLVRMPSESLVLQMASGQGAA